MTLLRCNYLIFTNLLSCYFHSYCYNCNTSYSHFFQSPVTDSDYFLVRSKSMLALLPFKATLSRRHSDDKGFHRAGGNLACQFCICASHFQCIVGAQLEIQCLTVRTTWLIWKVWPQSFGIASPCMTVTPWSRANWKMCNKNSTFACHDAMCTQFSLTWPHSFIVHDLAVLTDFPQRDGSDSTCGRSVHVVQNKTPEQTSTCFANIYGIP